MIIHWLLATIAVFGVLVLLWRMWQNWRAGHYGISILMPIAVFAAVYLKQFWAAASLIILALVVDILIKRLRPGEPTLLVKRYDLYSLAFAILALGLAVGAAVFSGQFVRFVEVLAVASPYPLLIVPGTILSRNFKGLKGVKSLAVFEQLSLARAVIFNKRGGLLTGSYSVSKITAFGDFDETAVLELAAGLEKSSKHPLAQAIMAAASDQNVKPKKAKHIRLLDGPGLQTTTKGQDIVVGSLACLRLLNIKFPAKFAAEKVEHTAVYLAVDNQLAGIMEFEATLPSDTAAAIDQLKQIGIKKTVVISNDSPAATHALATQLGLDEALGNMAPVDKLRFLDSFKDRPLIFVGDPLDASSLNVADISVTIGDNNSAANINCTDLSQLIRLIELTKQIIKTGRQIAVGGLLLSLALMAAFASGKFSALEGTGLQTIIIIFATGSALMVRQQHSD